jgi:two-component system NtrC family response regulator/two-component system response regulator AtoC
MPQVSKPRPARTAAASSVTRPRTLPGAPFPQAAEPEPETRCRILIVDDDEPIRVLLSRIVQRQGFAADLCADGGEAIQRIGSIGGEAYVLILLDLMMPGINGFEFLEHLKKHQPELLERVIVLTASPKIDDQRITRERIRDVIHKPFDIHELSLYIQRATAEQV